MGAGQYKKGQHLYVSRGLYTHHGLGDGRGGVIHYSEPTDGPAKGRVRRTSLDHFARGGDIKTRAYQSRRFSPDEAVKRAESCIGKDGYSLWGNNCEHFVSWCITGDHDSNQVNRATAFTTILLTQGARKGAIAVVASQGTVAGLSGSGIMSGLATTGGIVGGGGGCRYWHSRGRRGCRNGFCSEQYSVQGRSKHSFGGAGGSFRSAKSYVWRSSGSYRRRHCYCRRSRSHRRAQWGGDHERPCYYRQHRGWRDGGWHCSCSGRTSGRRRGYWLRSL